MQAKQKEMRGMVKRQASCHKLECRTYPLCSHWHLEHHTKTKNTNTIIKDLSRYKASIVDESVWEECIQQGLCSNHSTSENHLSHWDMTEREEGL